MICLEAGSFFLRILAMKNRTSTVNLSSIGYSCVPRTLDSSRPWEFQTRLLWNPGFPLLCPALFLVGRRILLRSFLLTFSHLLSDLMPLPFLQLNLVPLFPKRTALGIQPQQIPTKWGQTSLFASQCSPAFGLLI